MKDREEIYETHGIIVNVRVTHIQTSHNRTFPTSVEIQTIMMFTFFKNVDFCIFNVFKKITKLPRHYVKCSSHMSMFQMMLACIFCNHTPTHTHACILQLNQISCMKKYYS